MVCYCWVGYDLSYCYWYVGFEDCVVEYYDGLGCFEGELVGGVVVFGLVVVDWVLVVD